MQCAVAYKMLSNTRTPPNAFQRAQVHDCSSIDPKIIHRFCRPSFSAITSSSSLRRYRISRVPGMGRNVEAIRSGHIPRLQPVVVHKDRERIDTSASHAQWHLRNRYKAESNSRYLRAGTIPALQSGVIMVLHYFVYFRRG
jgi:hypothetical protein